ncbi:GDP-mannose 4,6-dehydratase [Candidatus Pacearchaeota archaeon]|nr:GDP-mannose 4,6-dehydratase [Candidatus Pacearchaeota archaeon]
MNDLRSRRILITGVAGFIGANLVRRLIQAGGEIHAIVRERTNLWRIKEVLTKLTLHRVDLLDFEELQQTVNRINPEIIIHLAKHGPSPEDRWETLETNIIGTSNLLEVTSSLNYQCFIHTGTSLEYGPKSQPMTESDILEPSTFFGVTKASATMLCQQFAKARGRPIVILRPFMVYGYWDVPTNLIPTAIRAAMRKEKLALTPPGYRRDWVFIEDVIEAYLLTIQAENIAGEIINMGSGEQWSNEEIVDMVQDVYGQKIEVQVGAYSPRSFDTTHWVADIQKARKLLGWEPRHILRRGLEKTISWFRLHQDAYNSVYARKE